MRAQKSRGAMWCVPLVALLSGIGAHAAADTKKPIQKQPFSAVADTQAGARRQGAVNVSGMNWECSGTHCSTSTMPSAVAAPLTMCQGLARTVGAIRSFKVANRPLNGNELQQCNSVIPAVAAAMPSVKTPQGAGRAPTAQAPTTGFTTQAPITSDLTKKLPATNKGDRKGSPYPENWTEPDLKADKSPVFEDLKNDLRKNDQTAMPSAKKPSGAKGAKQASAQGDGKASSPSPPPPSPAKTEVPSAPGSRSYPVSIRTEAISVTGTGRLADLAYTQKNIRTEALTVTGTGHLTVQLPFTPKSIRTDGITVTGTGSVR